MSKPRTMAGRKMVSLPPEMWQAIEDFRFENRFRSEAEAIRVIVERGLKGDSTIDRLQEDIAILRAVAREWAQKAGATEEALAAIDGDDPGAASSNGMLRKIPRSALLEPQSHVQSLGFRRASDDDAPGQHHPRQPTPRKPPKKV